MLVFCCTVLTSSNFPPLAWSRVPSTHAQGVQLSMSSKWPAANKTHLFVKTWDSLSPPKWEGSVPRSHKTRSHRTPFKCGFQQLPMCRLNGSILSVSVMVELCPCVVRSGAEAMPQMAYAFPLVMNRGCCLDLHKKNLWLVLNASCMEGLFLPKFCGSSTWRSQWATGQQQTEVPQGWVVCPLRCFFL